MLRNNNDDDDDLIIIYKAFFSHFHLAFLSLLTAPHYILVFKPAAKKNKNNLFLVSV